jgi:hypothetical protein
VTSARVESCPRCGCPDILELFRLEAGMMPDQPTDIAIRACGECAYEWEEER